MDRSYWKEQLQKYRRRSLSDAEEEELLANWIDPDNAEDWKLILGELFREEQVADSYQSEDWHDVLQTIFERGRHTGSNEAAPPKETAAEVPVRRIHRGRWAAVAAMILLATGIYFWQQRTPRQPPPVAQTPVHDARPGGSHATLTLAGGKTIVLDSAANGSVALQGTTSVNKTGAGQLVYQSVGANTATAPVENTLATPRGGQYQLTLPDGSKVWLNAASSITYPTAFNQGTRKVHVAGEAYFEIVKNSNQPFEVEVSSTLVRVLGTEFNVNAYSDEPTIRTTLVQGSVKISVPERAEPGLMLTPGQQAVVSIGQAPMLNAHPDIDEVMAWKNGSFQFNRTDVKTTMRQLARWYDVEVIYEGAIPNLTFWGTINRDLNLSEVLRFLQRSGVHFSIVGKRLIVRSS